MILPDDTKLAFTYYMGVAGKWVHTTPPQRPRGVNISMGKRFASLRKSIQYYKLDEGDTLAALLDWWEEMFQA